MRQVAPMCSTPHTAARGCDSLMSMLRPKLHFLTARACRKELRFQEDLKSWGGSHLRNLLPPGLALRHGSADVMKLSDLRDGCRPITVGNTSERCHLWSRSCSSSQTPLSDIDFFDTHDILTIFQFDAIYRDILTIFFKCKLGLNAPKFHSRNAYVDIFATKLPIYGIF